MEKEIQKAIELYLREELHVFTSRSNAGIFSKGSRTVKGMVAGFPDLFAIFPTGRFLGIEVKQVKGKQRPKQESFQALCESQDIPYFVVHSFEEFKTKLDIFLNN